MPKQPGEKEVKTPEASVGPKGVDTEVGGKPEPTAQEQLEQLRTELAGVKDKLTKAEDEAKAHQKNVTTKAREIEQLKASSQELEQLRQTVGELELRLAISEDAQGAEEAGMGGGKEVLGPKTREVLNKIQKGRQPDPRRDEFTRKVNEVQDFIVDAGFDPNSEDFAVAKDYTLSGMFAVARREAKQVIAELKKEKTPEPQKSPGETEAEMKARIIAELGLAQPDASMPSGAKGSWEEARDAFIKNPSNPKVFERYMRMKKERES